MSETERPVRLAELIAALSLATDLGLGQPIEYLLRTCLLAMEIGVELKLGSADLSDIYFSALLRWIGCSGHAHEASRLYGDELAARARLALLDLGNPRAVLFDALGHIGEGRPLPSRLTTLAGALARGPRKEPEEQFRASCEVGRDLASRLGLGPGVVTALWHAFERWDGNGFPNRVAGENVALAMRVVLVAHDAVVFEREVGIDTVVKCARERSGGAYDPAVASVMMERAPSLFERVNVKSAWDATLATEPGPHTTLVNSQLDQALEVVADFSDLKSTYTGGHSRGVASLAAIAGGSEGLGANGYAAPKARWTRA